MLVGTPDGIVEEQLTGGFRRIIRVPPNPETLEQVAATSGGTFFEAPDAAALSEVYEELGSRLGTREQDREITDVFAAIAGGAAADRGNDLGVPVQEGPVTRLRALCVAVVAGAALAVAAPAGGANECDGLMVCIPVAGPWVVVPTSTVPSASASSSSSPARAATSSAARTRG